MSHPSRVRVYLACSLDGCIAGPQHQLDWLHEPAPEGSPSLEESSALGFESFMAGVGALLMGRNTYDVIEPFEAWPYGDTPVLVATRRPLQPKRATIRPATGDIASLITEAREAAGEADVYLDGGDLVRQGLAEGLVDELCLTLLPVLLGEGVRLFDGLTQRSDWTFLPPETYGHMVQLRAQRR